MSGWSADLKKFVVDTFAAAYVADGGVSFHVAFAAGGYGVNVNWLLTGDGEMFDLPPKPQAPIRRAASEAPDSARPARFVRFDQADILRLERAVTIVEEGLEAAGRVARPEVKAGMISAAFEMLEEPSETTVGRILRLVKG